MKINEFTYSKKTGETKDYEVLILNESEEYVSGISIKELPEDEKDELFEIQKEYEMKLGKFMGNYRQFIRSNIING